MSRSIGVPRFVRMLLVMLMVAAALVPAALFAAPPAQDAVVTGVYASDPIDTGIEGSDGLIVSVSLFEDGTMEAVSDFQDGETPIFEQGVWSDLGDGTALITFAFSDGEPYDPAVEVLFEIDGDVLAAPDLADYGPDGLVIFLTDADLVSQAEDFGFDATVDVVAAMLPAMDEELSEEEAAADDEGEVDVFDIEGVYISNELVDDTGTGAVMIYMSEDGIVESFFNNFDGETAPVGRMGTWEETEDGLVVVTLDQELLTDGEAVAPEDLDEAEVVEFELINGVLVTEDIVLYPVDEIVEFWAYDEEAGDEAMSEEEVMSEEEAAADEGSFAMFMSTMDSIMAGDVVVIFASEDGFVTVSVERSEAGVSLVANGFWEETEDGLLMIFEEDEEGNALDAPIEVLFEEDEDGNLVGVEFDAEIFGDELILEPSEE